MEEWARNNNITLDAVRVPSLIIEHNNYLLRKRKGLEEDIGVKKAS
jgi:hypothetical protein